MTKFIQILAFLAMALLVALSNIAPESSPMWLASTTLPFTMVRSFLMVILFMLLITRPPRNKYFRLFVGVTAVFLATWVFNADSMKILDSASLLGASAAMGISVLEYNPATGQLLTHTSKRTVAAA